ncbi:thioesterase family protein [Marinobacter sp. chi1]|uniref:Thioesterase family protein n=1 Tax=Marinobacter suaedae TaxID=3057675 RepID=A0ABT8W0A3_9GAMM|nr:thioesterase family protein [Marinobacter sp. chi1]MDO3721645.1 thioesterase family protein [Marinobacter sp. chi1]
MERSDFPIFYPMQTRWMDNDIYGHVNNVTYYSYFDSAINRFLIEKGGLNIHASDVVGFVVSSNCQFRKPLAYPDAISVGLRVAKIGHSSVTYETGIFRDSETEASAYGQVVHVFVSREHNTATRIPESIHQALEQIVVHHFD